MTWPGTAWLGWAWLGGVRWGLAGRGTTSATWQGLAGLGWAWRGQAWRGRARQGVSATAFVLAAAAVVVAGSVAGPFTAPLAVTVLAASRVGARLEWGVGQ